MVPPVRTLLIIDQCRALVEALTDAGNPGAARIVEQAADHIEDLAASLVLLEEKFEDQEAKEEQR